MSFIWLFMSSLKINWLLVIAKDFKPVSVSRCLYIRVVTLNVAAQRVKIINRN